MDINQFVDMYIFHIIGGLLFLIVIMYFVFRQKNPKLIEKIANELNFSVKNEVGELSLGRFDEFKIYKAIHSKLIMEGDNKGNRWKIYSSTLYFNFGLGYLKIELNLVVKPKKVLSEEQILRLIKESGYTIMQDKASNEFIVVRRKYCIRNIKKVPKMIEEITNYIN